MSELNEILAERGKNYGNFQGCAHIAQGLKAHIRTRGNRLAPDQAEALEMVFHKAARILNGDPNHIDSWQDIAGYAQLVVDRLKKDAAMARA